MAEARAERRDVRREAERVVKVLVGAVSIATILFLIQLLLSRLFARAPTALTLTFDYVVDVYADKIVVTSSDGKVVTLASLDDFNNWLKSVRGKRILIYTHALVAGNIFLTQNEYWIFGEGFDAKIDIAEAMLSHYAIVLTEKSTKLYIYTHTAIPHVTNANPTTGELYDVSGLRLYAVQGAVSIFGASDMKITDVVVYTARAPFVWLVYVDGDAYILSADEAGLISSTFRNLHVVAINALVMTEVSAKTGGCWGIASYRYTVLNNMPWSDIFNSVSWLALFLRFEKFDVRVGANSSTSIDFGIPSLINEVVYVESIGVVSRDPNKSGSFVVNPLPQGVTYSIDPATKAIIVSNNTSSDVSIYVSCIVWHIKVWYG